MADEVVKSGPVVSAAMITYNHERFITQAIETVLAQQTTFPIELVIGEDASSDDTRRHVERLRAQAPDVIRTLYRPANIGMHSNLQGVLEACRGEFIAFLEGDDHWTSRDKLQTQVDLLQAHAHFVGTFHPVTIVDALDRTTGESCSSKAEAEIATKELLSDHNIVFTPSVVIRRDALPKLPNNVLKLNMREGLCTSVRHIQI